MTRIVLLTAHDIAEFDDLRMFTDMGHDVFSIGAYTDPAHPASEMRPALPNAASHPWLAALCDVQREKHAGDPMVIRVGSTETSVVDWAKADLHPDIIDWADVIICHHYEEAWLVNQWPAIRHKRVIWRTCGQSDARKEGVMARLRADGLEIVRYSPKEEQAFTRLGVFAGQDALIRFGKYPADWDGWTGEEAVVGNVTQNMAGRGEFCGLTFWLDATQGLPAKPAGPHSELLPGGIGALSYDEMRAYLRSIRAYVYTGTQPASYTLGLIEAMMTGVPVVSIGPESMWVPDLFEGQEIVYGGPVAEGPAYARDELLSYLGNEEQAKVMSGWTRERAIDLFDIAHIAPQWQAFLDGGLSQSEIERRIGVTA